jgi:two-component system LytT family sensor kinase
MMAKIIVVHKRDELKFPTFWQLQTIGWIGLYALTVASVLPYVRQGVPEFPSVLQGWVTIWNNTVGCGILLLASCALRPICRSLRKPLSTWFQLELRAFAWCSLVGTFSASLIQLIVHHFHAFDWIDLIGNSVRSTIALLFWCNLYFSIKQWQQSAQERERLALAEAEARDARLTALRYQLNPHFLFNSLNAVSTLVLEGDVLSGTRMLAQIGDLLRASLDKHPSPEVSLSQEMVFTERYLAIEQTRLGERLQVDLEIAGDTLEAAVPSMLLQPLVENAIRHGIAPLVEGGKIAIRTKLNDSRLQLFISNTGSCVAVQGKATRGIGLANTFERLQTLYGADQRLDLQWPVAGGCELHIEIPFRRLSEKEEESMCGY